MLSRIEERVKTNGWTTVGDECITIRANAVGKNCDVGPMCVSCRHRGLTCTRQRQIALDQQLVGATTCTQPCCLAKRMLNKTILELPSHEIPPTAHYDR